jgi:hypothetical protein
MNSVFDNRGGTLIATIVSTEVERALAARGIDGKTARTQEHVTITLDIAAEVVLPHRYSVG